MKANRIMSKFFLFCKQEKSEEVKKLDQKIILICTTIHLNPLKWFHLISFTMERIYMFSSNDFFFYFHFSFYIISLCFCS